MGGNARPLVSIVMSNHNYGRFLSEAVDSALSQTYLNTQVVVVDDGSTDESRNVLAGYRKQVRTILQPNRGQAAAMNAGVAACTGDLVMFLDADDALHPEAAAAMVEEWRPGIVRVQGIVRLVDESGKPTGGRLPNDPLASGDAAPLMLRSGGYAATGTTGCAYSRECLECLLPIPEQEWRIAPDTFLWVLSPFVGPFGAVAQVVGSVRLHGANKWSMTNLEPQRLVEHLEVDAQRERLLREWGRKLRLEVQPGWLLRSPNHLQSRLALLRLASDLHPYRADRAWVLALRGVLAALRHRGFAARKRWLFAAWFIAAGLLPSRLAGPVIRRGFLRPGRPAWLQRFLEQGGAELRRGWMV